jgi:hypothetical protein
MWFDAKKVVLGGLAAGLAIFLISWAVSIAIQFVLPFDIFALGGMREANDPLMAFYFAYPWVLGFAMSIAFAKFKDAFKARGIRRGRAFGLYAWVLAGLPNAFLVFTSMNYPLGFTVNAIIGSLLYMLAAGVVLEKTIR